MSSLVVKERDHNKLFLERSKLREVGGLIVTIIFFGFWYYLLLREKVTENDFLDAIVSTVSNEPMLLLFLGAPLLSLKQIISGIKAIVIGESYSFNRIQRTISKNRRKILQFSEVQAVQIRVISGGDSPDEYRLCLLLNTGDKKVLETSSNEAEIKDIADHIADVLNVSVIFKK